MLATGDALGSPTNPLRWVPDLVGKKSGGKGAVMIIGSAYAPFVAPIARRRHSMTLAHYQTATPLVWQTFSFDPEEGFLAKVVGHVAPNGVLVDDPSYYGKITAMLNQGFDLSRIILTDWCRASFVKRETAANPRVDTGGDSVCGMSKGMGIFFAYVEQNFDWHRKRFCGFSGKLIILGGLAHDCLKFFCLKMKWRLTYHLFENLGIEISGAVTPGFFWTNDCNLSLIGRIQIPDHAVIEFVVVSHPAARPNDTYPEPLNRTSLVTWLNQDGQALVGP